MEQELEKLKSLKESLQQQVCYVESKINAITSRTADGYPIEVGKTYWYQGGAKDRIKVDLTEENCFFGYDCVWVTHDEHSKSGFFYRRLYKNRYADENAILLKF